MIGGTEPAVQQREPDQTAINAIPGFAGTATVTGAASTGFTVTYTGASAGLDVPNAELVDLSCGGCFGSVEETNHGGANDSFTLNYNGTVSGADRERRQLHGRGDPGRADADPARPARRRRVAGFGGGSASTTRASRSRSAGTLAADERAR